MSTLPDGLRKLVDLARKTDDRRFESYGARLNSTLYKRFERQLRDNQDGRKTHEDLQLSTFYSPQSYLCRPVQSLQPGSLSLAFHFYAKLFSPDVQLANKGHGSSLTYDSIRFANTTISLGELICFATDFGMMPAALSREAVLFAWQRHQRWKKHMDASYRGNELRYDDFVEVLIRCALLAFPSIASPRERVEALARLLRLTESKWYVERLESIGRTAGASKVPLHHTLHRRTKPGKIEGIENAHSQLIPSTRTLGEMVETKKSALMNKVRQTILSSLPSNKERRKSIGDVTSSALLAYKPKLADTMATHAHNATSQVQTAGQVKKPLTYSMREQLRNRQRARFMRADDIFSFKLCELLESFRYEAGSVKWLPFSGQYVDMGVLILGTRHSFRVRSLNTSSNVFQLEAAVEGVPDCCVDFDSRSTPQGFSRGMFIRVNCKTPGEYLGELVIHAFVFSDSKARPRALHSTYRCPVYCNIQDPRHNLRFRSIGARLEALGGVEGDLGDREEDGNVMQIRRSATSQSVGPAMRTKQESRKIVFGMSLPSPAMFAKGENITLDLHATKRPLPLQIASRAGLRTPASCPEIDILKLSRD